MIFFLEHVQNFFESNPFGRLAVDLNEKVVDLDLPVLVSGASLNEVCDHYAVNPLREDHANAFELLFQTHPHFISLFRTKERGVGIEAFCKALDDTNGHEMVDAGRAKDKPLFIDELILALHAAHFSFKKGVDFLPSFQSVEAGARFVEEIKTDHPALLSLDQPLFGAGKLRRHRIRRRT